MEQASNGTYLTVEEVADYLRTTPAAIYSSRHQKKAPGILGRQVGRRVIFSREAVDAWFANEALDVSA